MARKEIAWQGPSFRSLLIPAIFARFAMTAKFFGWSTTFGSRWRQSLKTRSRNLDLFRSRTNSAAETPPAGREPLSSRHAPLRRIRADGFVAPCIPTLAAKPPFGPDWVHEIKHDGYRLIVRRDGKAVRLFTRRGYDWTDRYPAIARAAAKLRAMSFTIDGEAVVAGADGIAIFDALHRRGTVTDAMLYAFDLVELDGKDLRPQPLGDRKAKLAKLLARAPVGIIFNEHTDEDGVVVFRHACK
jgi:bifunctional non-homologous end joining protein LigD